MLLFKLPKLTDRSVQVHNVQFSPDGRHLLMTTSRPDIAVLDAVTGHDIWADRSGTHFHRAAYAPDGRTVHDLSSAYDRMSLVPHPPRLHTRDADTGRDRGSVEATGGAFVVTPDQKHLLYATSNYYRRDVPMELIRAELATGTRLDSLTVATPVRQIVVSPDGRRAAVRGNQRFVLVALDAWKSLFSLPISTAYTSAYGTQFAPDGRTVVTSIGPHLRIFDSETGAELREVRDRGTHVQDLCFTPDGRYLFTASNDTTVKVRDTATWEVVKSYTWKAGKLRCLDVSPDGLLAAAGSATGKVVVWDVDL
jgi:WD40 repeat protein